MFFTMKKSNFFKFKKKKISQKWKDKKKICIKVLCFQYRLTYPVYFGDSVDLLLTSNENKSHYM